MTPEEVTERPAPLHDRLAELLRKRPDLQGTPVAALAESLRDAVVSAA